MSPARETGERSIVRSTSAMRRWWLKRFTREEIRELAGGIWTDEAVPAVTTTAPGNGLKPALRPLTSPRIWYPVWYPTGVISRHLSALKRLEMVPQA